MGDYNSGLPIRSEADGADERVHVKIVDGTTPSQRATVDTDGNVHVESHGNDPAGLDTVLRTSEEGHLATNGIYDVASNTDPSNMGLIGHTRAASPGDAEQVQRLTAGTPTANGLTAANIHALDTNGFMHAYNGTTWDRLLSTGGALNVNISNIDLNGVYDVSTNPNPDSVGSIFHTRAAAPDETNQTFRATGGSPTADNVDPTNVHALDTNGFLFGWDGSAWDRLTSTGGELNIYSNGDYDASTNPNPDSMGMVAHDRTATPGPTHQNKRITGVTSGTVHALDVSLHDELGNPYSATNPMPVSIEQNEGLEIHNYNTAANVAGAATSNHNYSVANGVTFQLHGVLATASGKMKIEVQVGDGALVEAFLTKGVRFNSTAQPDCDFWLFDKPITVVGTANTTTVRVIRTNKDNQPQDLYTTIVGVQQ